MLCAVYQEGKFNVFNVTHDKTKVNDYPCDIQCMLLLQTSYLVWTCQCNSNILFLQSSEAYEFIKRDLTEFSNVVQHDTACSIVATASAVRSKLAVGHLDLYYGSQKS